MDHPSHFNTTLSYNYYEFSSSLHQSSQPACDVCSYSCFFESGLTIAQQCAVAVGTCLEEGKVDQYNFFSLLFCYLSGNIYLFIPLALLGIYLIFGFVSATVEEYIAGGITYVSEALELSEALAAVTLLAFANGAGDVITAIVASGSEGGVSYNVGALYGAGFFVCSMVICLTILASSEVIIVDKGTIFRDIGFYVLSTIVTLVYAYLGKIYTWSAVLFLFIYFLMVLAVYIQDKIELSEREQEEELKARKEAENQQNKIGMKQNPLNKLKLHGQNVLNKIKVAKAMNTLLAKKRLLKQATIATDPDHQGDGDDDDDDEPNFADMNLFEKFMYLFEYPLGYVRKFTMPPSEKEKYDKILCILWPFPGILFLFYGCGQLTMFNYLVYGVPLSFILTIIFYVTQKDLENDEVPSYFMYISLLSTVVGLVWTYIACAMLIDLLNTFIVVFKLNQTYMGLTVLGVGNALPDALTTVALAKKGYAQMGITGSYAGQLFGLLIGFGLAQIKTTVLDGPQDFSLFEQPMENLLDIVVIVFALLNLLLTAAIGILQNYHFKRSIAYVTGFLYVSFFIVATGIQIYYLINGIQ